MIPLHVKSHYSLGIGTASIEAIVDRAAAWGLPAIALTDLETMAGQIQFHHLCRSRGVRAITGLEIRAGFDGARAPGRSEGRLILIARDEEGYANLCRIVTRRRARSGSVSAGTMGEDPLASLRGRAGGLFAFTDDVATCRRLVDERVADLASIGLLLVRPRHGAFSASGQSWSYPAEEEISAAAQTLGVRLLADVDAVYLDPSDHDLHLLLTAIRLDTTMEAVRRERLGESPERYSRAPGAARSLFADQPEALLETERIARSCTLDLCKRPRVLPPIAAIPGSPATAVDERLARLCRERLTASPRGARAQEYETRLRSELEVIAALGLASYFLAVEEIVAEAARRGIPTAGRGSAAGSLVCYLLGITEVDPVACDLYFERFLHARRNEPPDIDVDVDSSRRDELLDWIRQRHGHECVAMVAAYQRFRKRGALRAGLKAFGMAPAAVDRLMERIPPEIDGANESPTPEDHAFDESVRERIPMSLRNEVSLMEQLHGIPSHLSVHPAGVIIASSEISGLVPLERAPKGVVVTQYDLRSVQEAGLLKIDLLGNHALTEMAETIEWISSGTVERSSSLPGPLLDSICERGPAAIPLDDAATFHALDRGETVGCFQVESPAVRSVLRMLPIRDLDDLAAALAVVRPGAAAGDAKHAYVQQARGTGTAHTLHPGLGASLAGTFGIPLFEEDVIRLLHTIGRYSLVEADELRARIVSIGDDAEQLARQGDAFVKNAVDSGSDEASARAAWDTAVRFAAYSFSKAHAASQAILAYRAVFLRTHVPVAFGCALINHHAGMYPRRTIAAEVARWGVTLHGPSILRSEMRSTVVREGRYAAIRMGLQTIKRLRRSTARALLETRSAAGGIASITGLLERVALSRAEATALILCGACDGLAPLSEDNYPFVHEALLKWWQGSRSSPVEDALGQAAMPSRRAGSDAEPLEKYRRLVRIRNELEHLEMHPSGHPMEVLRADATAVGCAPISELHRHIGAVVRVAAVVAASRRVRARDGQTMQFVTLEDERAMIEAVLFPAVYQRFDGMRNPGPYLVRARVMERDGDLHLSVIELRPFHERNAARTNHE